MKKITLLQPSNPALGYCLSHSINVLLTFSVLTKKTIKSATITVQRNFETKQKKSEEIKQEKL
jgi:hypothetical protein